MNTESEAKTLVKPLSEGLLEEERTESIIGAFYEVYNTFGYGLLEKAYANALSIELEKRGHFVRHEVPVDIWYKGIVVARYCMDRIVDERIVVEFKSTKRLGYEDPRQLLNYLRATRYEVGLLLHFGPRPQFHRLVSTNQDRSKAATPRK